MASGRRQWPNRDPIGELGGVNLYSMVGNDPMDRIDLFGLAPGDSFPTMDDAAKDACNYIHPKTKKDKVEYAGWITQKGEKSFTYSEPSKGTKDSSDVPGRPPGGCAVFHSHVRGETFSPPPGFFGNIGRSLRMGDVFTADDLGVPMYLATPKGDIKCYQPDPKKNGEGRISTIGSCTK